MAGKLDRQALSDVKRYAIAARDAETAKEAFQAAKKLSEAARRVRQSVKGS